MRLLFVAMSSFSLLIVCDPALARMQSGQRHVHSELRVAARSHGKVVHRRYAHVRHRAHAGRLVERNIGTWRPDPWRSEPDNRFGWRERNSTEQYGSFQRDDRYAVRQYGWSYAGRAEVPSARRDRTTGSLDGMIARHAQMNGVPEPLVRRVVLRESGGNPRVVGRGGAMGLMQIKSSTARAMGYGGSASGLLDPETNLTYAVRYLAGAYQVAGGNFDRAVSNYARGYYAAAKRRGSSPYVRPDWADAHASY